MLFSLRLVVDFERKLTTIVGVYITPKSHMVFVAKVVRGFGLRIRHAVDVSLAVDVDDKSRVRKYPGFKK
eukprot:scaffold4833_cov233-Amphora_coffeaeformis.AAC.35